MCNVTGRIMAVHSFKVSSGSSKVVHFGNSRNRICDLPLMITSNLGLILHRFGDRLKIENCQFLPTYPVPYSSLAARSSNVGINLISVMGKS